ncbi:Chaperone protein DnaK [Chitinispirillum alkaliphilum]|nr:Chaperone protein DnaK [Chitinispirillum alkaliphilum]
MMEEKEQEKRFIVGIDLGTTNSAVSFVDTFSAEKKIEDFPVFQAVAPGEFEKRDLFPSFHYESARAEFSEGALRLPWSAESSRVTTGIFARNHGANVPGRLVVSAKSWLSHSGVDRTAPLLPWHAAEDVEKISPVEVTSRYLNHILQAWNHEHPQELLQDQEVIITVPASFDEIARELTVEAAIKAGFSNLVLLEEPQAAFYSWINTNSTDWQQKVSAGQKILICDIGGGTTDFTLIEVKPENGGVRFHRIAVGDHLILGGDNQDLALAYYIEKKLLEGKRLTPRQFTSLVRSCQFAKEKLLGESSPASVTVNIAGTGTSLIGSSIQATLTREEAQQILIDGFFPVVDINEKPETRQSGFQEFGLPYAPDAAVTRYLASFLTSHAQNAEDQGQLNAVRPDIILFNGGVLSSETIQNRVLMVLKKWFSQEDPTWSPDVLSNMRPELAVSRGAAYFGLVRRGTGVRISAGLARSYYIGVEVPEDDRVALSALCLAPAGLQEGQSVDMSGRTFSLLIRQPVEFPLYVSSIRTTDSSGELVEIDPLEMHSLPPIRTVLRSGKSMEAGSVEVVLHVRLTEIGTLDLWCTEKGGNRSWKLQFDVRSATRTDISAHRGEGEKAGVLDIDTVNECLETIVNTFRTDSERTGDPRNLMKRLEHISGIERLNWPPSFLRSMWEAILENESGRSIDIQYETRWLNLLGFSLRPGYGMAIDDWRVKQTWQIYRLGVNHPRNQSCRSEWWILWRRLAGGLTYGQQNTLAQPLLKSLRVRFGAQQAVKKKRKQGKSEDERYGLHELCEIWRLLASLENLESSVKKELGEIALNLINRKDSLSDAVIWSLGRLGARVPMYGPLNKLVDPETVSSWVELLMSKGRPGVNLFFSIMQMGRFTGDRYRDLSAELREKVASYLNGNQAPAHYIALVKDGGSLDEEERSAAFGESLPKGLRISG